MIRAALTGSVKKLGALGAIIVGSAVANMCADLYLENSNQSDTLDSIASGISYAMSLVFPNSLNYFREIVSPTGGGVAPLLAFYVLIDIPLAYACGLGVEKLRRRYGLRAVGGYAAASFALCLFFAVLSFRYRWRLWLQ